MDRKIFLVLLITLTSFMFGCVQPHKDISIHRFSTTIAIPVPTILVNPSTIPGVNELRILRSLRGVLILNDSIYISGPITMTTYKDLMSLSTYGIRKVIIDSNGGKLLIALKIANFIRENNMDTYVPKRGKCYSSCTVIFQSGIKRYAHYTSVFIYHYAFFTEPRKDGIKRTAFIASFSMFDKLKEYGIKPELIDRIELGKDLRIGAAKSMKYNVVTNLVNN